MPKNAACFTHSLDSGNDFERAATHSLASDAVRTVDFEFGMGVIIVFGGDFYDHTIGEDPEGEGFHWDWNHLFASEFEMRFQKVVTNVSKFFAMTHSGGGECNWGDNC